MVDLSLLQSVSYIAGALGVCVAAFYYVMNLRISQRNQEVMLRSQEQTLETRRIGLVENIAAQIINEEGMKRYFELMNYEWTDYEDFDIKYGSENNVNSAAKRFATWALYNKIGMMLRRGAVDIGDLYVMGMQGAVFFWAKYKPIIEETRRRYNGDEYCKDVEYLAVEMLKYLQSREPSYKIPEKLDHYDSNK
jgi:hypothetical protein